MYDVGTAGLRQPSPYLKEMLDNSPEQPNQFPLNNFLDQPGMSSLFGRDQERIYCEDRSFLGAISRAVLSQVGMSSIDLDKYLLEFCDLFSIFL